MDHRTRPAASRPPAIFRRLPGLLLPLVLLPAAAGCTAHGAPAVFLVFAPPVMAMQALSDVVNTGASNGQIVADGRVVDADGRPVDGVRVRATLRSESHRRHGLPDRWDVKTVDLAADGDFRFTARNCVAAEFLFHKDGYLDRRLSFSLDSSPRPDGIRLLFGTFQAPPRPDCDAPFPPRMADLDGVAGRFYEGNRPLEIGGLTVVLEPPAPAPLPEAAGTLRFDPAGGGGTMADPDALAAGPPGQTFRPFPPLTTQPAATQPATTQPATAPTSHAIRLAAATAPTGEILTVKDYDWNRPDGVREHVRGFPRDWRLVTDDPDGGFIPYTFDPIGSSGWDNMRHAPPNGYLRELPLTAYVYDGKYYHPNDGVVFFYFKAGGRYGKGMLTLRRMEGPAVAVPAVLRLQPDGSTDLRDAAAGSGAGG